mmetsp:Transcript_40402/g.67390  ORF Transcript_40402/g.67390 Transcript_40402/m.67390 type:complete len:212 (+) Transcript_40402:2783-3418(+)
MICPHPICGPGGGIPTPWSCWTRQICQGSLSAPPQCLLHNLQQLYVKDQCAERQDHVPCTALPVRQVRGDVQPPRGANLHQTQGLRPALDHPVHLKRHGLAPFVGAVELGAVDEGALVVGLDGARGPRGRPGAGLQDLELQPGGGGGHPFPSTIDPQEVLFGLLLLSISLAHGLLHLSQRCPERLHFHLCCTTVQTIGDPLVQSSLVHALE